MKQYLNFQEIAIAFCDGSNYLIVKWFFLNNPALPDGCIFIIGGCYISR